MEDLGWEVRLYSKDPLTHFNYVDTITEYREFEFSKIVNNPGNGQITLPYSAFTATMVNELLQDDCLIAFAKPSKNVAPVVTSRSSDVVFGFLPENIQDIYGEDNIHWLQISGPGIGQALDRTVILPASYPAVPGAAKRAISATRALDVWVDMMAEGHARQASSYFITPWTWNGTSMKTIDSKGTAWDTAINVSAALEVTSGTGMLALLKWARDFGGFDFSFTWITSGANLIPYVIVYQSHNVDVSNSVHLSLGRHHISGNRTRRRESVMSHLYSEVTKSNTRITHTDGGSEATYGKREFFWSDATQYFDGEANSLGTKIQDARAGEVITITFKIVPNLDSIALVDYDLHDLITYDNPLFGIRDEFIVKGIAVTVDQRTERQEIMIETPQETFFERIYNESNRLEQRFKYDYGRV